MFRKPKKQFARRVFSGHSDEELEEEKMSADPIPEPVVPKKKEKENKNSSKESKKSSSAKLTLLSFGDDEEEDGADVFQVKKSSNSKKLMKMLDRERRKKKKELESGHKTDKSNTNGSTTSKTLSSHTSGVNPETDSFIKNENSKIIQTEIRTDEFVLVVKNSQPDIVLNGRAALCAGKNDISSEEDEAIESKGHTFEKPDKFKLVLDSGQIPDAAMIHAARKKRQKAREQGDFIPLEEKPEEVKKGKRVVREDGHGDGSDEDDDRVDMSGITGMKDLEEHPSDDSDAEMHEWENQQIRKGVTGAQLASVHQESMFSNVLLDSPFANSFTNYSKYGIEDMRNKSEKPLTTAELLKQAYESCNITKPKYTDSTNANNKTVAPQTPKELLDKIREKFESTRATSRKHFNDIDEITETMASLKVELDESKEGGPLAAEKYRFYQDQKGYLLDLIECLDEKVPQIQNLEESALNAFSKYSNTLIERRRQDVRDQAKDMAEASKPLHLKKNEPDDPTRVRRAAEREGRRTRRRRDRERNNTNDTHYDGMSSDDEVNDHERKQHLDILENIRRSTETMLDDAADDFAQINGILSKFEAWKRKYPDTYNDAYIHICIPKILGPLIKLKLVLWNPLEDECDDFEKSQWYEDCMRYAINEHENEESLLADRDSRLVPTLVEKLIIPKVNDYVEKVWDPLSTTQTFRLVQLMSKLGRDYPSMRKNSKSLRKLFTSLLDKIKLSIENDVFIPIFAKQSQEGKSSFFQRQFNSGLKLFRNILSWQGILADEALKQHAILSLLNRYLLLGMRSCSPVDAVKKAHTILYTMPRVWLAQDSPILVSLEMFIALLRHIKSQLDNMNPMHLRPIENVTNILRSLHVYE
uniref:CSON010770 protein n=1 Tax=Culicoides sonorensis TaxID=179676 RepID=A0A336M271_CULSO